MSQRQFVFASVGIGVSLRQITHLKIHSLKTGFVLIVQPSRTLFNIGKSSCIMIHSQNNVRKWNYREDFKSK